MIANFIVFMALLLGSITDIKKHEVPDTLNFSLIAIGLLLNAFFSIFYVNISFLINSVTGLLAGFCIGAIFYYSGQWGGGDSKMIMGIGAVIGLNPFFLSAQFPFFLLFIISSMIVGAVYGLLWLVFIAILNRKKFLKEYNALSYIRPRWVLFVFIFISAFLLLALLFGVDSRLFLILFVFLILLFFAYYSSNLLRAIEASCLIKKIKVSNLVEGDWVIDEFNFKGKNFKIGKTGIDSSEINFLKREGVEFVRVKEGVPYIPGFFITYILLLIFGNWFWLFF